MSTIGVKAIKYPDGDSAINITDGGNVTLAGTLNVTGAFTSQGIDDNADAVAITIDNSEHVGIGTASPDGTLHVHSASAGSVTANTDADDLVVENSSHAGINILSPDANRSAIQFGHTSDNLKLQIRHDGATSLSQIISDDTLTFNVSGGAERIRINSSGNVGIATTTPYATLHVDGPSTTAPSLTGGAAASTILQCEDFEFAFGLDNASPYSLYAQGRTANTGATSAKNISLQPIGGNIGIGTRSPSTRLHIRSAVASSIAGYRDGTTGLIVEGDGASYIQIIASKTNPMGILFDGGNTHNDTSRGAVLYDIDYGLAFKSGGATRWKIDEAGDIIPYSTSSGIVLGSTSNVASNTLDDYEEGTHTFVEISGQASITNNRVHYTKIGRLVTVQASIAVSSNSNTNPLNLSLPFASSINGYYLGGGNISYTNVSATLATKNLRPNIENAANNVFFLYDAVTALTCANASNCRIDFAISYYT